MASSSKTTRDHDEIRQWAEERGGKPAHVASTETGEDIGILRLEFPGATNANDSSLEPISWDQFFEKFDERGLSLLYQEETAEGAKSNFNKLISGATAADAEESGHTSSGRKRSARSGAKKAAASARKSTPPKSAATKKSAGVAKKAAPAKKTATKKKAVPAKKAVKKAAVKKTAKAASGRATKKAVKKSASRAAKSAKKVPSRKSTAKKATARSSGAGTRKRR